MAADAAAAAAAASGAARVLDAAVFAAGKHRVQRRKDGLTPYINHPLAVAQLLSAVGRVTDAEVLQAAVLHDTVEDTDTSLDELERVFGRRVRDIVAALSDDKTLPKLRRKELQVEHAAHKSTEGKLVSLADKINNVESLLAPDGAPRDWSPQRIQNYIAWAKKVVDGYRGTNAALEQRFDALLAEARAARSFVVEGERYPALADDWRSRPLL